ncbi:MAG: hypothetical protein IKE70_06135, partial [Bacilli bacterium]|nr:hypothetical protein [Bacilli bacterium]
MITQLIKVPKYWPIGSQKYMEYTYKKPLIIIDKKNPKQIMKEITKDSISVAISWILLVIIIGILYITNTIPYQIVFILSTIFYVCDVICIIGWCPFKTFYMHNKCCTTC